MSLADHLRKLKPRGRGGKKQGPLRAPLRGKGGRFLPDEHLAGELRSLLTQPEPARLGEPWIHASQLWNLCTRQHVLGMEVRAEGETPLEVLGASRRWRYDLGWAVHEMIVEHLATLGLVEGRWRCAQCATMYPDATDEGATSRRPARCGPPCESQQFTFVEPRYFNTDLRVVGSVDAIVVSPRHGREPLEIKSVAGALFNLRNKLPLPEHVFRSVVYAWLTGLPRTRLLYASMDLESSTSPFREFVVPFDVKVVRQVEARLRELGDGRGVRACASPDDPRAIGCPVADRCWRSMGYYPLQKPEG